MKRISSLSFDLQHRLADCLIAMGIRSGYDYKVRLDERLTFTITGK